MGSIFKDLCNKKLINNYPYFIKNSVQYEVIMGSVAYGVSDDTSDMDIYGFCIPPKDYIFPHLRGEIYGFGKKGPSFEQFQQHHIIDSSAKGKDGREYDITIYSIIKFFNLCMENNPNMIDSLFVPKRCILHSTKVGDIVRENRKHFLHKGSWHKFKGYAYSQVHKMKTKNPVGKRKETIKKYGFDVKFAYHVVRLLNEVEQILTEKDLDLERNREQLKAIRRGEWTPEEIGDYFSNKEKDLESLYTKSTLQYKPDESKIKEILLNCLEQHFGDLNSSIIREDEAQRALREIDSIIKKINLK